MQRSEPNLKTMTAIERQILTRIFNEEPISSIAGSLNLIENTVIWHYNNALMKLKKYKRELKYKTHYSAPQKNTIRQFNNADL